jgi:hypothetical protein
MPMQYEVKYVVLNVCQGLELICNVQWFVEWFAISGEEILGVENYHILYYSRGIEGGQPIYQMHTDCLKISCSTFVLLTYLSFFCIALSTIVCLLFNYLLLASNDVIPMVSSIFLSIINKGNNKITELRAILQRESQNS